MMKLLKSRTVVVVAVLSCLSLTAAEGGPFRNRRNAVQRRPASQHHQSYTPRTRMGQRRQARVDARDTRDTRVAERTGRTVDEVRQKRIRRLETLGAILGGAGAGLSGAASTMDFSTPTVEPFGTSSSSLPSNFSNRMQMNSFNRNYSTNLWHAPVQ
ncbi:hypothetical protein [Fuerstiella marisgermanici]|uniref:Uncharacterized protein n=1 Tax=Fuerstiella marisgermanici TaxID=1891926 RepID=A0A1P8WEW4_9PLAN|nr:hypothetical protein [Fuerstiella marisgermanici]APZ92602.1 hypothetical protein Fuma_02213 [Fuerstiella marisgermanici]